jgi:putative endonuclease
LSLESWKRGREGEAIATQYLLKKGYRIIAENFISRWGEIDIIARSPDDELIFFEVKSYAENAMVHPLEAVTPAKIIKIEKTVQYFLYKNPGYAENEMRIEILVTDTAKVVDHLTTLK